jgi:hypothetical protein
MDKYGDSKKTAKRLSAVPEMTRSGQVEYNGAERFDDDKRRTR